MRVNAKIYILYLKKRARKKILTWKGNWNNSKKHILKLKGFWTDVEKNRSRNVHLMW